MKKRKYFAVILSVFLLSAGTISVFSQGAGINTSTPDNSAMLDISSTGKGALIPRTALTSNTDVITIPGPAVSLMVYNTGTGGLTPAGFYSWNGSQWTMIGAAGATGATGTGVQGITGPTGAGAQGPDGPTGIGATGATGSNGISFTHYLGELYGGGVIFYLFADDTGEHGLTASLDDVGSSIVWTTTPYQNSVVPTCTGCTGCITTSVGAKSDWNGLCNTYSILKQNSNGSCAALSCANYNGGSYTDWYLPAVGEINQLYNSLNIVNKVMETDGNGASKEFLQEIYWTSTESADYGGYAHHYDNDNGYSLYPDKYRSYYVRCIRRF